MQSQASILTGYVIIGKPCEAQFPLTGNGDHILSFRVGEKTK